jgi:hypothetical protein
VFIDLLFILEAHRLFQFLCLVVSSEITPSIPGKEVSASESEGLIESAWMLLVGLVGRGENVPWLQGPS